MLEVEIKIRIGDPKAMRDRLLGLGAALRRERHRENNVLFDFPDGRLKAGGRALRLRLAGRRASLTFKGPTQKSRRFKVREEFETGVRDLVQARKIVRALGLRPVFRYAKMRTAFRMGKVSVCLDETLLGNFLELEGERPAIARLAEKLGFPSREWITAGYVRMLAEAGYPEGTTHSSPCPSSSSWAVSSNSAPSSSAASAPSSASSSSAPAAPSKSSISSSGVKTCSSASRRSSGRS
ncbi:MAG: class IV adenylate cyclase [Candidatus Aminicenantes bacterium]|nr:class IV adenylate cyclase [Candidatus Aminicenantes bacterium]